MKIKFYLICIFLFATFTIKAQTANWLEQAKNKVSNHLYQEASLLYERVLFDSGNEAEITESIFGKLECLKKLHAFKEATDFIKLNIGLVKNEQSQYKLYEQWITLSYLSNELEQCLSLIQQAKLIYSKLYNEHWLTPIAILCLNEQNKWSEAQNIYINWLKLNNQDTVEVATNYKYIPKLKSIDKAGWLSTFIPGAGQFYARKPIEAITSIIIQGIGIYYGIYSFEQQYYISAWLVGGGIFGSFHFGSTRRSEELVKQYNLKHAHEFNQKIKAMLIQHIESIK